MPNIDKECYELNSFFLDCTIEERCLYFDLFIHAEMPGVITGDIRKLQKRVVPILADFSQEQIEDILRKLYQHGLIVLFRVNNGDKCLWLPDYWQNNNAWTYDASPKTDVPPWFVRVYRKYDGKASGRDCFKFKCCDTTLNEYLNSAEHLELCKELGLEKLPKYKKFITTRKSARYETDTDRELIPERKKGKTSGIGKKKTVITEIEPDESEKPELPDGAIAIDIDDTIQLNEKDKSNFWGAQRDLSLGSFCLPRNDETRSIVYIFANKGEPFDHVVEFLENIKAYFVGKAVVPVINDNNDQYYTFEQYLPG